MNTHRYQHIERSSVLVDLLSLRMYINYHMVLDFHSPAVKFPTLLLIVRTCSDYTTSIKKKALLFLELQIRLKGYNNSSRKLRSRVLDLGIFDYI